MAISIGILLALFSWLVKPLPWKYTFNYRYLSQAVITYLDNPASLKLIPVMVFIAFEAMFVYTLISPFASLMLLIVIIPVISIRFVTTHMNIYLHTIFLLAIFGAALCRSFYQGRRPFKVKVIDIAGLSFLLYLWLSLWRSHSLNPGLKDIFAVTLFFAAYFRGRLGEGEREKNSKMLKTLAVIGGITGLQAVLHFIFMKKGLTALYEERFYRAYGGFTDPTALANFLIMSIPLAGAFYLRAQNRFKWGLMLAGMLMGLFLTFSRSAWLSLGLVLLTVCLFKLRGSRKFLSIFILLGLIAGWVAMSQDNYVVSDNLAPGTRLRSIYARQEMLRYALKISKSNFWRGLGPGNFSYINMGFDTRDMVNITVPNTYLYTMVVSGAVGLGLLAVFLTLILRRAFKFIDKGVTPKDNFIVYGLAIGITANLIHGLFENIFYNIISNWIFGLILGLLVSREEADSRDEECKSQSS